MPNPTLVTTPFANTGTKNNIPDSGATQPQLATMQAGFPAITQVKISEGGIPPERADFNGILNLYGQHVVHLNKGLGYEFDATYATKIGGYPLHAVLTLTNGDRVQNTVSNNIIDPNVNMTGWKLINSGLIPSIPSVDDLISIINPKDGDVVFVESYHSGLNKGGGHRIYNESRSSENDQFLCINGWVLLGSKFDVTQSGATGDGIADDSDAIQRAVSSLKSIHLPSGNYRITKPIVLSGNVFEITGVKGNTTITGSGGGNITGYFQVNQQFHADFGTIRGITFDSDDHTKQRIGIYSTGFNYITHWKISECNFNGRMTGGIIGNLIACHIYRCYFGVYFTGSGNNLIAIQSYGSVEAGVTTNINVIEQCEFANCGSPTAVVDISTGYKVIFRDCIFEQLNPVAAVVLLSGVVYPVFDGCWFENAQGNSGTGKSVIWTRRDSNNLFCEVLTVNECLFHTYTTIPDGLINFSDSPRKVADFSKNLIVDLQTPIIVGGNSTASFVNSYGNSVTVGTGGDAAGLQYDSAAKFDLGLSTTGLTFTGVSTNPNALDDYKEGVWTPTVIGAALTQNNESRYTKIGRLVCVQLDVTWSANTDVGLAIIQGLPFSSSIQSSANIGFTNYSSTAQLYCSVTGTTMTISTAAANITNTNMSEKRIILQAVYSV